MGGEQQAAGSVVELAQLWCCCADSVEMICLDCAVVYPLSLCASLSGLSRENISLHRCCGDVSVTVSFRSRTPVIGACRQSSTQFTHQPPWLNSSVLSNGWPQKGVAGKTLAHSSTTDSVCSLPLYVFEDRQDCPWKAEARHTWTRSM